MASVDPGMLTDWYKTYMKDQPKTAGYDASQAQASTVSPDRQSTVQGQLTTVLDKGGPLADRAATRAAQAMNGKGLLNSSIAVSAGQSALYDAALPIAQQDAKTFADAGQANAQLGTQVSLSNAGFKNDASKFGADALNQATSQQRAAGIQSEQTAQQQAEAAAGRDFTTSERLGTQGFQAGESAATRQQQTALQASDLAAQKEMQTAGFGQQATMQAADLASRYDLARMDVQSRAALQEADAANQMKLQQAKATLQTGLQATDNAVKQSMQQYDAALKQSMQGMDNQSRLQIATLDADNRTKLAEVEAKYKKELQANQSMAVSYQSMVDSFTRVMLSPELDAAAKQKAIGNLTTLYNNSLQMQSDVSGLELGTLLAPEDVGGTLAPTPIAAPAPATSRGDDFLTGYENPGGA